MDSTCPVPKPTTRSAMKVSSVSPLRWLTMTLQPAPRAMVHLDEKDALFQTTIDSKWTRLSYAAMASETEPIWLTLSKRQSHALFSIAIWIRFTLVTVRSSLKTRFHWRVELLFTLTNTLTQRVEHLCLWQCWVAIEIHANHLDRNRLR